MKSGGCDPVWALPVRVEIVIQQSSISGPEVGDGSNLGSGRESQEQPAIKRYQSYKFKFDPKNKNKSFRYGSA